ICRSRISPEHIRRLKIMKKYLSLLVTLVLPVSAWAAPPPASFLIGPRHGHATPHHCGCVHMAGGNTFVAQPSPDTIVVTQTGVVVAAGHPLKDSERSWEHDLTQELKIRFDDPKLRSAKLY